MQSSMYMLHGGNSIQHFTECIERMTSLYVATVLAKRIRALLDVLNRIELDWHHLPSIRALLDVASQVVSFAKETYCSNSKQSPQVIKRRTSTRLTALHGEGALETVAVPFVVRPRLGPVAVARVVGRFAHVRCLVPSTCQGGRAQN